MSIQFSDTSCFFRAFRWPANSGMSAEAPSASAPEEKLPQYWDLLSDTDQASYLNLKRLLNGDSYKRNRGHRIETFDGMLELIREFAEKRNEDDWKRFLVCGVCSMDHAIAINTRQMGVLIAKCKSSINGSLQKMGYSTNTRHSELWKILFDRIPLLKDKYSEIRQWTIRYKMALPCPPASDPSFKMHQMMQMQLMVREHHQKMAKEMENALKKTVSAPVIIPPAPVCNQHVVPKCPIKVRAKFANALQSVK